MTASTLRAAGRSTCSGSPTCSRTERGIARAPAETRWALARTHRSSVSVSYRVDDAVAREFAEIVAEARGQARRPKILDSLIAATARALDVPVYTQDTDFDELPGVRVVRV